ncbi:MAG: hypothetical protein DRQ62_00115 [Gammaproteobacteria bacterium]|nr:MAG: hypothetical protein DRQ62_00115 [Gammaproteobacteria bacterium]
MALLKDCELWYPKLDPEKPSTRFSKKNPTWEIQLRTESKEQKKEWEDLELKVKAVIPDEGVPYYRVNIKKRKFKADGSESSFVDVMDGNLQPVEPTSIGNGSIGNVRIFQYEYTDNDSGTKGMAAVLMGIQLTKHLVYVPQPHDDDFETTDTETVRETPAEGDEDDSEATPVLTPAVNKDANPDDEF